ncbi:uncharacterized protein LOC142774258 [Rhipicephalus microplus]|uniref:uncharacterized protein LOC142774258 n=1 Tax=Rhipicephalus microplus TaxID=6941 RepID=UPI003F6B126F
MVDEEKLRVAAAADCGIPWQTHQSAACQDYARSPDANFSADIKAANDHNGGTAVAYECTQTTDNKAVLLLSTSSSIACDDTVPSTSRADKAGASAGNSTRDPAGSAKRNKRKGIGAADADSSRGKKILGNHGHKCETCGRAFKKAFDLANHHRIHTGEKPFECGTCGRSFIRKNCLVSHQRLHTGEKPFKCPSCTKYFKSLSNLYVHERTHTNERPYTCEMCDYSSAKSSNLKRHQRTHRIKTP